MALVDTLDDGRDRSDAPGPGNGDGLQSGAERFLLHPDYTGIQFPGPAAIPERPFVGREDLLNRAVTALGEFDGRFGMNILLIGPAGAGKNWTAYEVSRRLHLPLWIFAGHAECLPEDLVATCRLSGHNRIEVIASPVAAAMAFGGIVYVDEIAKIPPRGLSPLASVLDTRREITSLVGAFRIKAHPAFRLIASMNYSDLSLALPDWLDDRLRPRFHLRYPPLNEMMEIVRSAIPAADRVLLDTLREWIAKHRDTSPRRAIALMDYVSRLQRMQSPRALNRAAACELMEKAAADVLEECTP